MGERGDVPARLRVGRVAVCAVVVVACLIPPDATVTRHVTLDEPTSWVLEHVTV